MISRGVVGSLKSNDVVSRHNTRRLVAQQDATVRLLVFLETVIHRRRPDPNRRSARAQTAILKATRELIGEIGYDKMSIEGIAAAAGVGKRHRGSSRVRLQVSFALAAASITGRDS